MKEAKFEKPAWLAEETTIYQAARTLAALPVLDRERQRRAVAIHFGVRVGTLDKLIKAAVEDHEDHRRGYSVAGYGATKDWPDLEHSEHPRHWEIFEEECRLEMAKRRAADPQNPFNLDKETFDRLHLKVRRKSLLRRFPTRT